MTTLEAYLIWALANLKPEELIALQFVISPTSIKDADATAARILKNDFRLDGVTRSATRLPNQCSTG